MGVLSNPSKAASLKAETKAPFNPGPKSRPLSPARSTATTQPTQSKIVDNAIAPETKPKPSRSELIAHQAAQEAALREAHAQKEKERAPWKRDKTTKKDSSSQETKNGILLLTNQRRKGPKRLSGRNLSLRPLIQGRAPPSFNSTFVAFEEKEGNILFPSF